jgi:hypothetical protein
MDTTLTQGLLERLDAVTAQMGVAATEVWSIWLATAWVPVAQDVVGLVLALVVGRVAYKAHVKVSEDYGSAADFAVVLSAFVVMMAAIVAGVCTINLVGEAPYLFEPRLYALDQLRGLVGK